MRVRILPAFLTIGASVSHVAAWGFVGHEIIATIAEIHLEPSTADAICNILPEYADCHLAPVAAWADKIRMHMRWSGPLHYAGGRGDNPPQHCAFGEEGWYGRPGRNALGAIRNTTTWLEKGYDGAEEALKFLIHFVGDAHQPLHLTPRDHGGNGVKVTFKNRVSTMHRVWDSGILTDTIQRVPKYYADRSPYPHIEAALFGKPYDPLVRQIMIEGIYGKFNSSISEWLSCPVPKYGSFDRPEDYDQSLFQFDREDLSSIVPPPPAPPTDDEIICPYAWAAPIQKLNCDFIWPKALDRHIESARPTYYKLDTPRYMHKIRSEWVMEKLLAMAGVRLAHVLNHIFADQK